MVPAILRVRGAARFVQAALFLVAIGTATTTAAGPPVLTEQSINSAPLATIDGEIRHSEVPDPAIVKLQVLLDRAGASPGVIDGFDGDNLRKAEQAFRQLGGSVDALARYESEQKRYEKESKEVEDEAKKMDQETRYIEAQALRFDLGEGMLEIGVVMASLYFISRKKLFPIVSLIFGVSGIAVAISGTLL